MDITLFTILITSVRYFIMKIKKKIIVGSTKTNPPSKGQLYDEQSHGSAWLCLMQVRISTQARAYYIDVANKGHSKSLLFTGNSFKTWNTF